MPTDDSVGMIHTDNTDNMNEHTHTPKNKQIGPAHCSLYQESNPSVFRSQLEKNKSGSGSKSVDKFRNISTIFYYPAG